MFLLTPVTGSFASLHIGSLTWQFPDKTAANSLNSLHTLYILLLHAIHIPGMFGLYFTSRLPSLCHFFFLRDFPFQKQNKEEEKATESNRKTNENTITMRMLGGMVEAARSHRQS